ncbi:MAG: hypothetical protein KDD62_06385, partial [Bdellovibrionales bacterium]|nr:hypothetical protein [Bdellovibrionales bacterium]
HNDHLRYWQVSKDDGTIKYAEYRATKKASQLVKVWREDETLRVVIPEEDSEITIVVSAQKRVPLAAIELALPEYFRKIEL